MRAAAARRPRLRRRPVQEAAFAAAILRQRRVHAAVDEAPPRHLRRHVVAFQLAAGEDDVRSRRVLEDEAGIGRGGVVQRVARVDHLAVRVVQHLGGRCDRVDRDARLSSCLVEAVARPLRGLVVRLLQRHERELADATQRRLRPRPARVLRVQEDWQPVPREGRQLLRRSWRSSWHLSRRDRRHSLAWQNRPAYFCIPS